MRLAHRGRLRAAAAPVGRARGERPVERLRRRSRHPGFAANLRNLLLQPPLRERAVMGIDPGFRTGCKVATVDPTGKLLHTVTIYPHEPQNERGQSRPGARRPGRARQDQRDRHRQRHRQPRDRGAGGGAYPELIAESLASPKVARLAYVMVSEAGASVYSASDIARAEFPDLDVSMRGAISIARRLQDPLAELVKIDAKSIGVGPLPARRRPEEAGRGAGCRGRIGGQLRRRGRQHRIGRAAGLCGGHQQAGGPGHRCAPGRDRPLRLPRRAEEGQGAGAEGVRAGRRLPPRARQPQPAGQHDDPPRSRTTRPRRCSTWPA